MNWNCWRVRGFAPFAIALVLLATVGGAIPLAAQDSIFPAEKPPSETPGQMALPDPAQLEPGWWQAIVSDTEDLDSQIDAIVGTARLRRRRHSPG